MLNKKTTLRNMLVDTPSARKRCKTKVSKPLFFIAPSHINGDKALTV
jgi:hypothetical protein